MIMWCSTQFYSVPWMLCDCDLRDMNLFVRLYRIEMEKRPIGTPCARGKHEMKFFRLLNYFRSIQIDSNRCFRSIVDGERWEGGGGGVSDLDRESCLHYFIRQLDCEQILCHRTHTITFLSSHSRPLTHFSFSLQHPMRCLTICANRAGKSLPKRSINTRHSTASTTVKMCGESINFFFSLFSGQEFIKKTTKPCIDYLTFH